VDTAGPETQRFASSVDYANLVRIEEWLAGTDPRPKKAFNGLQSPQWPSEFGLADDLVEQGAGLYQELCQGCHLPAVKDDGFWSDKHWQAIRYIKAGKAEQTDKAYLQLKIIPLDEIGTDPAQANVLTTRTVDTTGLGLDTDVCTPLPIPVENGGVAGGKGRALRFVTLADSATANFGLALGAFVERTNQQWFKQSFTPESSVAEIQGNRPNCLQVGQGYKARPLNGVWATAPFLHNGSIASVYDLLSPLDERPTFIELGNQSFDTEHLGIVQSDAVVKANENHRQSMRQGGLGLVGNYKYKKDYENGLFVLDTREPGNHNTGHLFDDKDKNVKGRIQRRLSKDERLAVIEFLKTL